MGDPPVRQLALPAQGMPGQEGGTTPHQQAAGGPGEGPRAQAARGLSPVEGGDLLARQRGLSAHGMPEQERGIPQSKREEDGVGASLEKRAHLAHVMHRQGDSRTRTTSTQRVPPEQCEPQAHCMQRGGGGNGAGHHQEGEGGPPPEQPHTPFMLGLNQEMEGHP